MLQQQRMVSAVCNMFCQGPGFLDFPVFFSPPQCC